MDKPSRRHLDFLDGIRGLSAFYVLLSHGYNMLFYGGIGSRGGLAGSIMLALRPVAFGRYAVDMFIVLSGYCLMLPVVRSGGSLRGGFWGYIARRATRILPPYYAALVLSLLLLAVRRTGFLTVTGEGGPIGRLPEFGDVLSHFLLVHNLFDRWAHGINSPMWSVASEWQIYFVFPTLLLPLWRRANIAATVVAAFTLGYALAWLVPGGLDGAAPWYIGLFALGIAAATVDFPAKQGEPSNGREIPWGTLCGVLMILLAVVGTLARGWFRTHALLIDPVFGVAAASLILYCVRVVSRGEEPTSIALRIFGSRWAVGLGAFSYSLYLVHYPLVELASAVFQHFAFSPNTQIAVTFGVCVPVITGSAYGFHLWFERPFMPGRPRDIREAQVAAEVSPAP